VFIHAVWRSVGPGDLAAGFVDQQRARRVVPRIGAFKDRNVIHAQHQPRILLGGAARDVDRRVMWRDVFHHRLALGRIDEHQRNPSDRRHQPGGARADPFAIDVRAAALDRMAHPPAERIEDPSGHRLAVFGQRNHHPEWRPAFREVVGAVERIDDPARGIVQPVEYRRICVRGLFADDRGFGQQFREPFGKDRLGFGVGHCHGIVGGLLLYLVRSQRLIARDDRARGGIAHDGFDRG
jgi:hypothetical protein